MYILKCWYPATTTSNGTQRYESILDLFKGFRGEAVGFMRFAFTLISLPKITMVVDNNSSCKLALHSSIYAGSLDPKVEL